MLKIDCPYRGSPKQLCLNFFQQLDLLLGTNYLVRYGNGRSAIDLMMTQMAQTANRHALGVLIVDEIQHLKLAKGLRSGGTPGLPPNDDQHDRHPGCVDWHHGGSQCSARYIQAGASRQWTWGGNLGTTATWTRLDHFVNELWQYQWTREKSDLTDDVRKVLYQESQGSSML